MYKYVTCIWDHGRDQLNEEINLYSLVSNYISSNLLENLMAWFFYSVESIKQTIKILIKGY